jgi:hypothetical protein
MLTVLWFWGLKSLAKYLAMLGSGHNNVIRGDGSKKNVIESRTAVP